MTRILVADDVEQNRYMLASLLRGHGYEVDVCTNGAEALELAQKTPPNLIISDLLMPVMDGFELCRRWKQDAELRDVPFMVYTATYTDAKDERLARNLGADCFLVKPQKVDVLLAEVAGVLERAPSRVQRSTPEEEQNSLREHNDALVRKLTKKVRELQETLQNYRHAEFARVDLEKQLAAAQRLESIGRLAGGVAHDFNNLLTVILSHSHFALGELSEESPLRADLEAIQNAGQRAAALTRQLLAFSRKQVLEPEVVNLNGVFAGIEGMLRRVLGEDIEFVARLAPDLGNTMADPAQLEQVIMNLTVNARDAMPDGGRLTVETTNVEIDEAYAEQHVGVTPGSYVLLSISDSGCGMDETTRERIFEPFFTTKELGKGTGLGLSIVHGIIMQSGGNVGVYSEPGHGATFRVYLPRVWQTPTMRAARAEPVATGGTETVLLVEDDEAVRRVAARILSAAGYQVMACSNGEEALAQSEHGQDVRLLITDFVMPRMGGRELTQRLQSRYPELKILYMSGYSAAVVGPGVNFIGKPFTAADLTRKVRQALDG